ncbi:hypothetical protein QR680_003909 [Steinernema hermaphroditum]|uniref:Uncharacterized protein n=1 Tax=Steinernema hermaphroditum TaxID=289476 RepID=A0AA39LT41_9BILA|nr:hypothetical protein QR680_003909 [Steinernema hermaphroditum]
MLRKRVTWPDVVAVFIVTNHIGTHTKAPTIHRTWAQGQIKGLFYARQPSGREVVKKTKETEGYFWWTSAETVEPDCRRMLFGRNETDSVYVHRQLYIL